MEQMKETEKEERRKRKKKLARANIYCNYTIFCIFDKMEMVPFTKPKDTSVFVDNLQFHFFGAFVFFKNQIYISTSKSLSWRKSFATKLITSISLNHNLIEYAKKSVMDLTVARQ